MVLHQFNGEFIQKSVKKVIIWKNEKLRKTVSNFKKSVSAGAGRAGRVQSADNIRNRKRGCDTDSICRTQAKQSPECKSGGVIRAGLRREI